MKIADYNKHIRTHRINIGMGINGLFGQVGPSLIFVDIKTNNIFITSKVRALSSFTLSVQIPIRYETRVFLSL